MIPAQLTARRGGARIGITLDQPRGDGTWHAFARNARRLHVGDELQFDGADDLLAVLGAAAGSIGSALSVVSYRAIGRDGEGRLLAWPEPLELGQPLPTVPLWLGADIVVPLDLEASHTATCVDLRLRQVA